MKKSILTELRLRNQKIKNSGFDTAKEIVSWMGAMQAQDFNMAKLAVGIRTHDSSESDIDAAIDNGEIIRTHALRPTWHFVSADDVYWILELTAPQIISSMKSRDRVLELDDKTYMKSFSIIEKTFKKNPFITRQELRMRLKKQIFVPGITEPRIY